MRALNALFPKQLSNFLDAPRAKGRAPDMVIPFCECEMFTGSLALFKAPTLCPHLIEDIFSTMRTRSTKF